MAIGVLLGAVAGTLGGWVEEVIMRSIDLLMAFPGMLLAIAMVGFLGPGLDHVMIALVAVGWVSYARLTRGQVLVLRESDFVLAARSLGAGPWRLITRHLVPNLVTPLVIEATFGMAGVIIAEAGLSFLGLGVQPPTSSWGSMLAEGRQFILVAPHLTLAPGVAIMLLVMSLNFLGDDLRDLLDPKARP
jgi:peptide/nickel transport system permease protein